MLPTFALTIYFVGATEFMLSAMLTPLAEAFDTTPSTAAWFVSCYALSYAFAAPMLGWISDRVDRRKLLLIALGLFAFDSFALAIAPTFGIAVVLRIFGGIAAATLIPTIFGVIADLIPANRRASAMGTVMLGMTAGIAFGPAMAGLLADTFDWRAPLLSTTLGCTILLAIAWKVIPKTLSQSDSIVKNSDINWWSRSGVLRLLVGKALWNGTGVSAFLLSGEILRQRYGLNTSSVSLVLSGFGIGLAVGNISTGSFTRLVKNSECLVLLSTIVLALSVATFMLTSSHVAWNFSCLLISGCALGIAAPVSTSLISEKANSHKGQALSLSESLNNIVILSIFPLSINIQKNHGTNEYVYFLGVIFLIAAVLSSIDIGHINEFLELKVRAGKKSNPPRKSSDVSTERDASDRLDAREIVHNSEKSALPLECGR